jgi:predicted  nucleic acid-binding Zn-ribbon protein
VPSTEELRVLIRTVLEEQGLTKAQAGLKGVQAEAKRTSSSMATLQADAVKSFGSFALGALGAQQALQTTVGALQGSIEVLREHERISRGVAVGYGQMASEWQNFATALSASTGFTSDAILQAALYQRTLTQNFGLTTRQSQELIGVAADLAAVFGLNLVDASKRLSDAIRGEAEASELLGLTLGDIYMKSVAANGAYRTTWETMTELEKSQARYIETLKQSATFANFAATQHGTLEEAFRRAELAAHDLQIALGTVIQPAVINGLNAIAAAAERIGDALDDPAIKKWLEWGILFGKGPPNPFPRPAGADTGGGRGGFDNAGAAETAAPKTAEEMERELLKRIKERQDATAAAAATTAKEIEKIKTEFEKLGDEIDDIGKKMSELGQIRGLLPGSDIDTKAALSAQENLLRIDQIITARLAAAERLRELQDNARRRTQIFDPRDAPGVQAAIAQVAIYDQLEAANRDLLIAEERKVELQREGARLSAEEARLRLDMLPAQTRMAELQRDITEQQARARLAALPATEALEDLRYLQQRAELISRNRNVSVEERVAARRQLRDIGRAMPGAELGALEAGRGVTLAGRAAERLGIEEQLFNVANERALAGIQLDQTRNGLLQSISQAVVDAQKAIVDSIIDRAVNLTVNITHADGTTTVYNELIEATGQAQGPMAIQLPGVRR